MDVHDIFILKETLNPSILEGMFGVILYKYSEKEFEVEFVNRDGTNIWYMDQPTFLVTIDQISKIKVFSIDGNEFNNLSEFFNTIGDQLVEGDWGHNWNVFNDILWGGFIKTEYEEPFILIWKNSQISKTKMNEFPDIVKLIRNHKHITLRLE